MTIQEQDIENGNRVEVVGAIVEEEEEDRSRQASLAGWAVIKEKKRKEESVQNNTLQFNNSSCWQFRFCHWKEMADLVPCNAHD